MKRIVFGLLVGCVALSGVAIAQSDPIKERQEIMKGNGKAAKAVGAMLKGETPYDAAAAASAAKTIGGGLDKFLTLFPDGSTSADSAAKPEIWQNKTDFVSWATKLKKDADAAEKAAAGGLDTFKAAFAEVGKDCKGCHEKYKADKKK